jgi:hypothetical protein
MMNDHADRILMRGGKKADAIMIASSRAMASLGAVRLLGAVP